MTCALLSMCPHPLTPREPAKIEKPDAGGHMQFQAAQSGTLANFPRREAAFSPRRNQPARWTLDRREAATSQRWSL